MSYSRLFADLSSNNAEFDAAVYRAAGHVLVGIKATEGLTYVNPDHRAWCLHAGLHHIGVVHYHFARPDQNSDPAKEAQHFLRTVHGLTGGRDYLVVDIERAAPAGWTHDPAWCSEFANFVQHNTRFQAIVYASRSVLQLSDEWLKFNHVKRVWDAAYGTEPDFAPKGYELAFRQFTDGVFGPEPHSLPGVGRCDVNRIGTKTFEQVVAHQR